MDIRINTKTKKSTIKLSSGDFRENYTLKKSDVEEQKEISFAKSGTEVFAGWFFSNGREISRGRGAIMIMPYSTICDEFKLYFSNKVGKLDVEYRDDNGVPQTETFNDVGHLYMKKADNDSFVLIVDVDMEAQISTLKTNLSSETQTLTGLQAEKRRLTDEYEGIKSEIEQTKKAISTLDGLVREKRSDLIKATGEKEKLEIENKAKEKMLIELNEQKEELEAADEMLTLNIDEAQKIVDTMKARITDDQDSVELMDDLFKLKKPISASIKDILKNIESVEKKIGLVARFQEKFADTVNLAVADTDGNGTIDALAEAGGELFHGKLHADEQGNQETSESN